MPRSEEHTSELQSRENLVCRLLLEKKHNAKGALTYTDIAGDPVLYGNLPPREISMKDVFRSGDLQERVLIRHHDYDQCFFFFKQKTAYEILA